MNGVDRSQSYGRMFQATKTQVTPEQEEDLKGLGKAMRDAGDRGRFGTVAGMTYFGQFIDHDLTYDITELGQRNVEPNTVPNFRTPRFDLDLIYGLGPTVSHELYEADALHLKVGKTAPSVDGKLPGGTLRDIARKSLDDHTPLHADPKDTRNLENLIVMQIHVLFMKFHNAAVDQLQKNRDAFKSLPLSDNIFEGARQLVLWHYQWLVRHRFLPEVAHHGVLPDVWDKPKIEWHEKGFFIPAEFSLVAFRFGHSMVRAEYGINCHHERVALVDLMAEDDPPRLREDLLFEWGRLFEGLLTSAAQLAPNSPINTAVAEPLHHLPEYTKRQHSDKSVEAQPKQLTARTLLRGARAHLPTGQEVAKELVTKGLLPESDVLTPDQLIQRVDTTNDASGSVLAGTWMQHQTPLYYYLLKEAEVLGGQNFTLGPIGSRIVAEVIETVLREDKESYLNTPGLGPGWEPPRVWQFHDGTTGVISTFTDLVQMVGDELPQGCEATLVSKANALRASVGRRFVAGFAAIGAFFRFNNR